MEGKERSQELSLRVWTGSEVEPVASPPKTSPVREVRGTAELERVWGPVKEVQEGEVRDVRGEERERKREVAEVGVESRVWPAT